MKKTPRKRASTPEKLKQSRNELACTHRAEVYLTENGDLLIGQWEKAELTAVRAGQFRRNEIYTTIDSDEPEEKLPSYWYKYPYPFPEELYTITVELDGYLALEDKRARLSKPMLRLAYSLALGSTGPIQRPSTLRVHRSRLRQAIEKLGVPKPLCILGIGGDDETITVRPPLKFILGKDRENDVVRGGEYKPEYEGYQQSIRRRRSTIEGRDDDA